MKLKVQDLGLDLELVNLNLRLEHKGLRLTCDLQDNDLVPPLKQEASSSPCLCQTEAVVCSKALSLQSTECSCPDSGYSPAFRTALLTVDMWGGEQ